MHLFDQAIAFAQHLFIASVQQSPLPLLVVAAFAGCAAFLYAATKGKEFIIVGYSSVLFLVPFMHLS